MKLVEKTEAISAMVKKQADLIFKSTVDKLQILIADKRSAKQLFVEEKSHFDSDLSKVCTS